MVNTLVTSCPDIIFEIDGCLGVVTLDRPAALNALSVEMAEAIVAQLSAWQASGEVSAILITSSSSRAFCAGGDVRQAIQLMDGQPDDAGARAYFTAEYRLDLFLAGYSLPIVSFVDGVVMGGGLGLCINAGLTYFSKTIKLAMPETAIGLFPDVGARLFLRRFGVEPALMLGMTGTVIGTGDALALGMGEGCLPAEIFAEARAELAALDGPLREADIAAALVPLIATAPPGDFTVDASWIRLFHGSPTEIRQHIADLPADHPYRADWLNALDTRCPASIAAIHHIFTALPKPAQVADALQADYHLALTMTRRADFREGVRAVLIDKDNAPDWQPAQLDQVDEKLLAEIFDFSGLPALHLA